MNAQTRAMIYGMIRRSKVLRKIYSQRQIARYQTFRAPENEVADAEYDERKKRELIQTYAEAKPKYVEYIHKKVSEIIGCEPDPEVLEDVTFCCLAYGFLPSEYFSYHFAERSTEQRHEYLSEYYCNELGCRMNDRYDKELLNNKLATYRIFGEYYHRDVMEISSESSYSAFLYFIDGKQEIVKKLPGAAMGKGFELIQLADYVGRERILFEELLRGGPALLEERVRQSESMAAFHAASVNTVRFISFHTGKEIQIPFCNMRTGRNGSPVDNAGAGGIVIGVNEKTGVVMTDGFDKLGQRYPTHPDSGKPFQGFQLPDFDDALALCRMLSSKLPTVKYIGWDLAHTDQGWIVIEGNGLSQMIGTQITRQRGLRKEFEDLVRQTGTKLR